MKDQKKKTKLVWIFKMNPSKHQQKKIFGDEKIKSLKIKISGNHEKVDKVMKSLFGPGYETEFKIFTVTKQNDND